MDAASTNPPKNNWKAIQRESFNLPVYPMLRAIIIGSTTDAKKKTSHIGVSLIASKNIFLVISMSSINLSDYFCHISVYFYPHKLKIMRIEINCITIPKGYHCYNEIVFKTEKVAINNAINIPTDQESRR